MTVSKYSNWADWIANKYWEMGDDESRTRAAVAGYANQGKPKAWYDFTTDEGNAALKQKAMQHMIQGGGLEKMIGVNSDDYSLTGDLTKNWQQHLPLLAGLGMGLYGMASKNPWMMLAGLASGGYGLYNTYNKVQDAGQTLKNPELLMHASGQSGDKRMQQAARQRLRTAYGQVAPYRGIAKQFGYDLGNAGFSPATTAQTPNTPAPAAAGTPAASAGPGAIGTGAGAVGTGAGAGTAPKLKKTGSYAQKFLSNFQVSQLIDEVKNDRNIDSRSAAEMIVAAKAAQQMDSRPSSLINVGEFARSAANGFGFEVGRTIGSLMTLAPAAKNTIRRLGGGGLFSGAKAIGVL